MGTDKNNNNLFNSFEKLLTYGIIGYTNGIILKQIVYTSEGVDMSITELMEKAKVSASKRTPQDRKRLLVKAHILDTDGYYDAKYFSEKTVAKSREARRAV